MRPVVLGVAGGSGAGKSTVVREIVRRLGAEGIAVIHHDAYYHDLSALDPTARALVDFDHPDSLETDLLVEHLRSLLRGRSVRVPAYDFVTHTREPGAGALTAPKPLLILEGILVLAEPRLRDLMDLGVFVEAEADVRLVRRLRRDLEQRGRTVGSVLDQYERSVRPMHLRFVEPSKRHADLLVQGGGYNQAAADAVIARLEALLGRRETDRPGAPT